MSTTNAARAPRRPTRWRLYLARTGEALEVEAPTLADALRQAGRPDACHVEREGNDVLAVTFDAEALTGIDTRLREGTEAERLAFALSCVVQHVDSQAAGLAENARLYRAFEERESVSTSPGETRQ